MLLWFHLYDEEGDAKISQDMKKALLFCRAV